MFIHDQDYQAHSVRNPARDLSVDRIQSERNGTSRLLPFPFLFSLECRRLEVECINIDLFELAIHLGVSPTSTISIRVLGGGASEQ
jgi:hypothetical protein